MTAIRRAIVLCLAGAAALSACRGQAAPRREPSTAGATVVLTPRALAVTEIQTESAAVATVPETFATTGEIEFDPARVVVVNAPVAGRIRRFLLTVGDRVAAGDTLVTIESAEFLSGALAVTAPRAGLVTALGAAPQQLVTAGAELLRIAAVDRVWLRVDLYGERAQLARVGAPIEASVAAFPDLVLRGRIAAVAPSVEGATQAVAARVPLDNPSGRLLPGMFADVRVATGKTVRGILVLRSGLIYDGSRRLVMIRRDSTFFPSVVRLGAVVGDRVVVLRGINPGEHVVVKGGYELYSAGYSFTRGAEEEGDQNQ